MYPSLYKGPQLRQDSDEFVMTRDVFVAAGLAVVLLCCGHAATEEDCELVFRRSAEVALAATKVTNPQEVERAVAEARAAKGKAVLEGCVGKRITEAALSCVKEATNAEALDRCLQ
jgi:hypothetical protein